MFVKIESSLAVSKKLFRVFRILILINILISLFGFYYNNLLNVFSGLVFLFIILFLSEDQKFRKNSFSLVFCFFSLFFIVIPLSFKIVMGITYDIGGSVGPLPYEQFDYYSQQWISYLFLALCWCSLWLGLRNASTLNKKNINQFAFVNGLEIKLYILGFIVMWLAYLNNLDTNMVRSGESDNQNFSILAFLLNDNSFLLISSIAIFQRISVSKENNISLKYCFITIFLFIVIIQTLSTSKAAIFSTLLLFYIVPLSLLQSESEGKVLNFRIGFFLLIVLTSPILYYISTNLRMLLISGYFDYSSEIDLINLFTSILYRFSWGGLDQYSIIFNNELLNPHNFKISFDFLIYIIKNFINLILPGTPFMESYYPSSQLFVNLVNDADFVSEYNRSGAVRSQNTQPYTIFGLFLVFFGFFAPLFLYFYAFYISKIYNVINNSIIKICLIYFFYCFLACFGPEIVIINTIQVYISCLVLYILISFVKLPNLKMNKKDN